MWRSHDACWMSWVTTSWRVPVASGPAEAAAGGARDGEEMASASAFISERWNVKEAASLVGAACAVTNRMQIATAATNDNTRHPIITASWVMTMHRMSGGRFTLGIGRGVGPIYKAFGIPSVTTAQMEDWARATRCLWRGEVVVGHDGPAWLGPADGARPRLPARTSGSALVAFGENTLKLGGRMFDVFILHTYFMPETLPALCEDGEGGGRADRP